VARPLLPSPARVGSPPGSCPYSELDANYKGERDFGEGLRAEGVGGNTSKPNRCFTKSKSTEGELRMATVALTIDYSNGAHKHFSNIPWKKGLTILEAIQATEGIAPKASITFG